MQTAFDFGEGTDIAYMREQLLAASKPFTFHAPRDPTGQLVKSLISSRTLDEVSARAYKRLVRFYPTWSDLAAAPVEDIQAAIFDVTHAEAKAGQLREALRAIAVRHPDFNLDFLKDWPIGYALKWLEDLPGVGPKVAASTLNFSTLGLPAFVVDTHVQRVLRRFGFVSPKADIQKTYDAVMAAASRWSATEFMEFHILVKRLGQQTCQARQTHCRECPIRSRCRHAARAGSPRGISPGKDGPSLAHGRRSL